MPAFGGTKATDRSTGQGTRTGGANRSSGGGGSRAGGGNARAGGAFGGRAGRNTGAHTSKAADLSRTVGAGAFGRARAAAARSGGTRGGGGNANARQVAQRASRRVGLSKRMTITPAAATRQRFAHQGAAPRRGQPGYSPRNFGLTGRGVGYRTSSGRVSPSRSTSFHGGGGHTSVGKMR